MARGVNAKGEFVQGNRVKEDFPLPQAGEGE